MNKNINKHWTSLDFGFDMGGCYWLSSFTFCEKEGIGSEKVCRTNQIRAVWLIKGFYKCRSRRPEVFCKEGVLRGFAKFIGKHLCQSLFFNKVEACDFIQKETLAQVLYCEFCEIFMSSYRTPAVAASEKINSNPF